MNDYKKEICNGMIKLANKSNSIFIGQDICYGNQHYGIMKNISSDKKIEMPVAEEMQMGISIGLSLVGYLSISIYQRMDFLLRSMDQIVNHLDKIKSISRGEFKPKVIIITTIGSKIPIDAGPQHTQDFTDLFKKAVHFPILKVTTPKEVKNAYEQAISFPTSIMIVEVQDFMK